MNLSTQYLPFLQQNLSPQRLDHSLGVMQVMGELAEIYQLDPIQAQTAGLLHDAAKELLPVQLNQLAESANVTFRASCEKLPIYLHGPVGAYLVEQALGITDSVILTAIAAHSYSGDGQQFHARLARCLRIADVLAPVKPWPGMEKLRQIAYSGNLEAATLLQCGWTIEYFSEIDTPLSPLLLASFEQLSVTLSIGDDFFAR